jgi:hypothetical protein
MDAGGLSQKSESFWSQNFNLMARSVRSCPLAARGQLSGGTATELLKREELGQRRRVASQGDQLQSIIS